MIHGKNWFTTVPVHAEPTITVTVTILNSALKKAVGNLSRSRGRLVGVKDRPKTSWAETSSYRPPQSSSCLGSRILSNLGCLLSGDIY